MRLLKDYGGVTPFRISTIKRQEDAEHRAAVGLMLEGKKLEGFDKFHKLSWVKEITNADARYRAMAAESMQAIKDGESWDWVLLLSPTHAEGKLVVDAVREQLKAEDTIGKQDREFTRWVSADLIEAERGDSRNYEPWLVDMIQYQQNRIGHKSCERIDLAAHDPATLPLDQAAKFQVYRKEPIKLTEGDILRFTAGGIWRRWRLLGWKLLSHNRVECENLS